MSILSNNNSANMGAPFFHEFKKQASFFFKEKIKTARLALTDVTPAQLLTEEATNGNPWAPDTRTLKMISRAAFEVDDYWRIVEILHKRLARFDTKNWRLSYMALIVLEHMLTHGPESVAEEFRSDKDVIREMESFQHIDEKGFDWGLNVRKKSEMLLKLLGKGPLLKEERDRARKLSRGIEGFGSFCHRTSSAQGVNSYYYNGDNNDVKSPSNENVNLVSSKKMEKSNTWASSSDRQTIENFGTQPSFKEIMAPNMEDLTQDLSEWNGTKESKPLLGNQKDDSRHGISLEDHPFTNKRHLTTVSLLSATDQTLQAC